MSTVGPGRASDSHPRSLLNIALELEAGPVWQTVNDVQIPDSSAGTRFSLVDLAGKGPQFAWRGYLTWNLGARHGLRALSAPLSFTETGIPTGDIAFNGDDFVAGQEVAATYKFNSSRAGWTRPRTTWGSCRCCIWRGGTGSATTGI